MSHKSWHLSKSTLKALYKSLVGSVLDYSAFIAPRLSQASVKSLQAIQNKAVRTIYKEPFDAHTVDLFERSGLCLVSERMGLINAKYLDCAIKTNNELIIPLIRSFGANFSCEKIPENERTLLCCHKDLYERVRVSEVPTVEELEDDDAMLLGLFPILQ